jgi:PAS domain-containing protein
VFQLQSRSREPGFKSPLRNSTDDLPRYEQKQTNIVMFHLIFENTSQSFQLYTGADLSKLGDVSDQGSGQLETHDLIKNTQTLPGEAQAICDVLNEFRLPRAIMHLQRETFIAWNESFRERTGYSAEQLHFAHHKDLIIFSESEPDPPESTQEPTPGVQLIRCKTRCSGQEHFATGYAAKREDGFVLLMLDVVHPTTGAIEDARFFGREEERNRIIKLFHDQVSPKLLAAVFEVVSAKEKLEAQGLDESKAVAKAAEKLTETIDAVVSVLDPD